MERYRTTGLLVLNRSIAKGIDHSNGEFLEMHLDERHYVGENHEVFYGTQFPDGSLCIDAAKKTFYDADQCIDFISSYEWKKIFLM